MEPHDELHKLVPEAFLKFIRDRIKAGVVDAEAKFDLNREDEDSITGALGQAISTGHPTQFSGPEGRYVYEIKSYKIRGRGINAPEKTLGADAIFQISVSDAEGKQIFAKGLPFQAKKEGGLTNTILKKQASDLYAQFETGIVVRYSPKGYTAVDARDLIREAPAPAAKPVMKTNKLAKVLGDDFLNCTVGRLGLYLRQAESIEGKGIWVFDTLIHRL